MAGAFSYNQITNLTIPSTVVGIGAGAFNDNQLPNDQAFIYSRNSDGTIDNTSIVSYGGANRTNVIIPSGVVNIGTNSFSSIVLVSVTIPNTVTYIGDSAFQYNQLTSITIPSSVITIQDLAFVDNQFTSVTIEGTNPQRFNDRWSAIGFSPATMP
jgi:hypothetical protein